MFGFLRLVMTLLICILVIGYFRDWFSFKQVAPDPQSNNMNINVSVDKKKIGSDFQTAEQKVAKDIQGFNNQSGNTPAAPAGRQLPMPRLNLGPITVQPSGQPAGSPNGQPTGQPEFQFSVPLGVPPAGEGR